MRSRVRSAADTCATVVRAGGERGRRGFVYFITSAKNIQAVKTAAAFGIISTGIQSVAEALNIALAATALPAVPVPWIAFYAMIGVFYVADYADANTEEWRSKVEEATGEEAADDDADEG